MFKNALLSIKKNWGKSLLLFIIMTLIANLVMAGLSIKNATNASMTSLREAMGSEVTLTYNMQNIMKNREKGQSMEETLPTISVENADLIKELQYVSSYDYSVTVSASSSDIEAVEMQKQDEHGPVEEIKEDTDNENQLTISGHTSMSSISAFKNEYYVLSSGRLLTEDDEGTNHIVISSTLASDNDLKVGDTFKLKTDSKSMTVEIVGIYTIETTTMDQSQGNRGNPYNTIYTSFKTAQTLNGDTSTLTSATYYLDDPEHQDAFLKEAESLDIDWNQFSLQTSDMQYQMSVSSLENMDSFSTLLLWIVIIAGSAILALILILTLRSRFYEFGVFLSLGQSKLKIILQQLIEVGLIAVISLTLSLGTGKMVANVVSNMLESSQNQRPQIAMNMDEENEEKEEKSMMDKAMKAPEDKELDMSLTPATAAQLFGITSCICLVSIIIPSIYIFRLSPREILIKKEG